MALLAASSAIPGVRRAFGGGPRRRPHGCAQTPGLLPSFLLHGLIDARWLVRAAHGHVGRLPRHPRRSPGVRRRAAPQAPWLRANTWVAAVILVTWSDRCQVAGARSPWPCWPPPAPSQAFAGRSAAGRAAGPMAARNQLINNALCILYER
jgi:hypothetical protein